MNMTVLFKKYTYGLLLIATTLIGCFGNFTNAGSYTYNGNVNRTINANSNTSASTTTVAYMPLPLINLYKGQTTIADQINTVECTISNLDIGIDNTVNNYYFQFDYVMSNGGGNSAVTTPTTFNLTNGTTTYNVQTWNVDGQLYSFRILLSYNRPVSAGYISFDYSCTFSGNNIIDQSKQNINISDYELKSNINQNYCTSNNLCPSNNCPSQLTKLECQTEYSLIPIEDIDQTYCINNNLCPIIEGTGDIQWSALYINNVQHLGNDIINIDIPEEIERDYNYGSGETNIDVIGYGYDQEKMQSMVNTQFTPPTSEDLENVIGKIADFLPLLAIMLLIVYAWRLIKKVF